MTVQTEVAKSGPYAGAGTTGPFTVNFRFLADAHLQVIKTNAAGTNTTLVLTTDYTVTGAGANTGTVTTMVAVAVGETLTIIRNVPFTQEADYVDNDSFPAESHERSLDQLTMETQQLKEAQGRSLAISPTSPSNVSLQLPNPQPNYLIGWNSGGDGITNIDPAGLAGLVSYGTFSYQVFNGDGVTTDFTLSSDPLTAANIDVAVGGVVQRIGLALDYIYIGNRVIRFITPPPAGTNNIFTRWGSSLQLGVATSVAGQTTFGTNVIQAVNATAAGLVDTSNAQTVGGQKTFSLRPITLTATQGTVDTGAATAAFAAIAAATVSDKRQAINYGPVDANGFFSPGGSTGGTSVTTTAINSAAPLVVNAAAGRLPSGAYGDRLGISTANLTWTGLTTNGTMYLFVDVSNTGVLTPASGTLFPTYQRGGTFSIANGQMTFNSNIMNQTVGNGATAVQSYRVAMAEVTVAAGVVTAIVWYRLNRKYVSAPITNPNLSASATAVNHALGLPPTMLKRPTLLATNPGALDGWPAGVAYEVSASNSVSVNPLSITSRIAAIIQSGASASNGLYYQTTPAGATQSLPSTALLIASVEGDF